jgi:UDP-N-acetyl-D-mannosaminuronic acid dehydrogenase
MPFAEEGGEELLRDVLAAGRLFFTADPDEIPDSGIIAVTIGTPVDEFLNPVHKVVQECFDELMPHLSDDRLIILRSTIYPRTLEWLEDYLKKKGKKPSLAFCPERVVQGKAIRELAELPQIVSGSTPQALSAARAFFELVSPEIVELTPMEAAFAKLFDNAYRYIQFAIANQFYMITNSAGVDYYKVLKGVSHNYPRAQDIPSAGFAAGPCLFKDTMQLAAAAGNQFGLGHEAMLVNEGIVLYIVDRLRAQYDLADMTVGLLGMAFKANSDDIRSSLSYKAKKVLSMYAGQVLCADPHVTDDPTLLPVADVIAKSDLLILCVPHKAYKDIDTQGKRVVDIWNFLPAGSAVQ